jgi:hypothetical protein
MDPSPTSYSPNTEPTHDTAEVPVVTIQDIPQQSLAFGGNTYDTAVASRPLPIRFPSSDDNMPARPASIQFMPNVRAATEASRSRSRRPLTFKESSASRRLSSPPPPT